ncbi:MAG: DNA gyrase subunit A [Candidatus Nanopelagicales bacterium]|nr:DNA gyrase subunit A [Candidatus Nanopelagicales bacterium]MDP4666677.1 DNA gyrase subunit A [Candidatus Nanopelagicales bacterium]MDP4895837.1 DNA gyrase subunit A [Candidatus Nanopelagicales bacterium]MDP5050414.1 DNA gyrase subunit A [Candidatus Nanopelagicales bacterium]
MTEINDSTYDQVEIVDLNVEMQRSYLDYAMSVIVSRALPDVRDGLKPVHRRVIYAMYDGGYRPDRAFNKSARVVGEVMGQYHPHGDSAIYDTLVRLTQSWSLRYPLVQGQGNFGSPGNDSAAASRYTECRMASLAMEMVRDIDQDTVNFVPNYDGKNLEPTVLPARFPNLLVNGSSGIAVGMATNIPPHNLTEVAAGVQWSLEHPDATREELLEALLERITGPDFPTGGQIVGRRGIQDAYRTGRGSITMRAVTEITEDKRGRTIIAITQLPYQVNPDNLLERIAELVEQGKVSGIADLIDESSSRTGMRIVVVLKRDAVPKVVLNNLFKFTQLQDNFGANMLALVDSVPRTLTLDAFVLNWIAHQVEVIQRRTAYRLRIAQERVHILIGLLKAIDRIDEVIALIRASESASVAQAGLIKLLDIDEIQAQAILDMQLRKLAALERNELQSQHDKLMAEIADYQDILANETRQRSIVSEELAEIVNKFGDERRTTIVADENDVTHEDLIAVEPIVVTLSADGYIKRTKAALYRSQKRGGRGVKGAALKQDDVVTNFFVTTTHHWILFFTDRGRVFRVKAYELTDTGRDARGQHVANLLSLAPEEHVVEVLDLRDYEQAKYLILATRNGVVKKSRLTDYDSSRSTGLVAITLRDEDGVVSAQLVNDEDDLLLVSKMGYSVRCHANDATLRPMGRTAGGVIGIRFKTDDDYLLKMEVATPDSFVVTVTEGGWAKRTSIEEWNAKGRGTQGVRAMRLVEKRGGLAGALICAAEDEIFAIASNGVVIRTRVDEIRAAGRDTMGVSFMKVGDDDQVVAVARSTAAAMAALESVEIPANVAAQEQTEEVVVAADASTQEEEV